MEDLRVLAFLHIPQGLLLAWAAVALFGVKPRRSLLIATGLTQGVAAWVVIGIGRFHITDFHLAHDEFNDICAVNLVLAGPQSS